MSEPRVLLTGLGVGESPRWHDDRLWFSNWGEQKITDQEIMTVDLDGNSDVIGHVSTSPGYAVDWLPDGRQLVTAHNGLFVRETPGAPLVSYSGDLGTITPYGCSEIVVDGRGNTYVNSIGFDFLARQEFAPGLIAMVRPDGSAAQVADGVAFPNGMVVTPDNSTLIVAESFTGKLLAFDIAEDGSLSGRRVWADLGGPGNGDGLCMDAEGAIWTPVLGNACARVREGGEVLQRIDFDRSCFACMLGGPDGRTLFCMVAEWRGPEAWNQVVAEKTGQVVVIDAPAPSVGWP